MLPDFEIKNFRAFSHLRIPKLGRMNLIVGKNNVGKTMLLEALRLYGTKADDETVRALLVDRDEVISPSSSAEEATLRIESLFSERKQNGFESRTIQLGPRPLKQRGVRILLVHPGEPLPQEIAGLSPVKIARGVFADQNTERILVVVSAAGAEGKLVESIVGIRQPRFRDARSLLFTVGELRESSETQHDGGTANCTFLHARSIHRGDLGRWWDRIALSDAEAQVIQCMKLMCPIERITLINHPAHSDERMIMVRLQGQSSPVPLRNLGGGMERMFQIAVAIQKSILPETRYRPKYHSPTLFDEQPIAAEPNDALLLIDEIENGIHYSVLPDLWRFLFRAAHDRNIQVFATTHSWDCIEAFQQAALRENDVPSKIVRLEKSEGQPNAVVFDEDELSIITRDHIEVR